MSAKSLQIRAACDLRTREREVLELLAAGETTQGIALSLRISPKTVEFHRHNLMARTGLHCYQELTKLALRLGLSAIDV